MSGTVVFLGPSLPLAAAKELLEADYRPPARRGDVYALLGAGIRRIVLVDGLFHGAPSVWQRELLAALDEGIEVLGASSMGALRAVELAPYGMIGEGTVFSWYRDGVIDGDDEVALLHGDASAGYLALSEPLVNIRATLARATAEGAITAREAEALLGEAKATPYPRRSLRALGDGALAPFKVNIKRIDAEAVLRRAAASEPAPPAPRVPSRDTHASSRAQRRRVTPDVDGEALHRMAEAAGVAARVYPSLHRRFYAVAWARELGHACPPEAIAAARERYGDVPSRVAPGEYEAWLADRALLDWLASVSGASEEAMARAWLADWGIEAGVELPDPAELGFVWPHHLALLVELLVTGEADRLVEARS